MGSRNGYFKSFDGTKLFYNVEGRGKPLVFCYGLLCSRLHWSHQIEYFRQNYKTICLDYRGHHKSATPRDLNTLTIENFARDLGTMFDELEIKKAPLIGHSMGVNVVLEFFRQFPERISALVLANGTAKRPLESLLNTNAFQAGFELLQKAHDHSPDLVSTLWRIQRHNPITKMLITLGGFNPLLTPQTEIDQYISQVTAMDPGILLRLLKNYDAYDSTSWLHTLNAPTLIVSGEKDKVIPQEQQELLRQLIPHSSYTIIQHGSHCSQMDLPEVFNAKIERFLMDIGY